MYNDYRINSETNWKLMVICLQTKLGYDKNNKNNYKHEK